MQVIVAEHAGFCWGVKRAIERAINIREEAQDTVYVLGHLVHNENVVQRLDAMDIKVVEDFTDAKKESVLLITAHGLDYKIIQQAKDAGFRVVDTTCPIVQKVHRFTHRFVDKGRQIIIIGHQDHIEVKGINSVTDGRAQIINNIQEVKNLHLMAQDRVGIVAQTTFNVMEMQAILEALKQQFPNTDFQMKDSICYDVKDKQSEIRILAERVDAVVVVGSLTSSNTTRLYEIAREVCPNTYFVSTATELNDIDFTGIKTVGVAAGASTPDWIIEEVIDYLTEGCV